MKKLAAIDKKLALQALVIFLVLMALFVPSFLIRQHEETELRETRERFTSAQVAERFNELVATRLRILELLEYTRSTLDGSERFNVWSKRIQQKTQGFYAINWVDPRGVITTVVPFDRNQSALGRNLLERPDVSPYLNEARDKKQPTMSHIVDLYQGPPGVVLYLPIFDDTGFKGWINGVFTADELIEPLMLKGEFDSSFLRIKFQGHPEKELTHGTLKDGRRTPKVLAAESLNQKIEIQVAPNLANTSEQPMRKWTWVIFWFVVATSAAVSVFAYLLMLSRQRLEHRLVKERVHGVLLNLLVHDIINPLMIVRFGGETLQRTGPKEIQPAVDKVLYGVTQINEVIGRVKELRAVESGRFVPRVAPVPVNDLIDESLRLFEQRIKAKGLNAQFEHCAPNPSIMVDRVIFQNNVLNNLLSNAVKFSEQGGTVSLRCIAHDGRFVVIEVKDQGVGMSEQIRKNLFLDNVDVTRPGTMGEKGTGIGMLQVQTYMKLFGGQATVESRAKTAEGTDHGTTFRLRLPQAH